MLTSIRSNIQCFESRDWQLAHDKTLTLGPKAIIMAIMNITPDSFSDGSLINNVDEALKSAEKHISEGAHILDIGGESTRPGADPVTAQMEQDRVLPVIEALVANFDVILSIDTYRETTADLAISSGAHIINDVWGLQRDPQIANVAAKHGAGVCIMHTGRDRVKHADVIQDQFDWLETSLKVAQIAGLKDEAIVLDPGFGFAKETLDENLSLLLRFEELHALNYPYLIGSSRKRFIGALTGQDAEHRDVGTSATSTLLRAMGGAIFRVHDVATNRDGLSVADGLIAHVLDEGKTS
ncbi:MAG: dihydropteroate synthase [Rhizobiaceae bacterium]|nr:dihydropteroate synthase [Rhizobiaceae bacterium]